MTTPHESMAQPVLAAAGPSGFELRYLGSPMGMFVLRWKRSTDGACII